MQTYNVSVDIGWAGRITTKVAQVMRMFGVDIERLRKNPASGQVRILLSEGDICYITGPSGAGKSVLINHLYQLVPAEQRIRLEDIELETDRSLIDCIPGDFFTGLKVLSRAGLSDVFAVLNQPANLSDGQKYRYRLARALMSGAKYIFADEFGASLDRISAAVIAHNIRKAADSEKKIFVLAGAEDDFLADLLPDVLVIKGLAGNCRIIYEDTARQHICGLTK